MAAARSAAKRESCSGTRKPRQPEGLELNPSLSIWPGRHWLPIETRRRRNHFGAGGEEDQAIRSRGLSGGAHSDGLRGEGGHRSVVLEEGQAEWRLDPAGVWEEESRIPVRVYTHGTLSAVQRRSDRAGAAELRGCQVRTTLRRFWNVAFGRLWNVRRTPARRYAL